MAVISDYLDWETATRKLVNRAFVALGYVYTIPNRFSCRHEKHFGIVWTETAQNWNKLFTHGLFLEVRKHFLNFFYFLRMFNKLWTKQPRNSHDLTNFKTVDLPTPKALATFLIRPSSAR